MAEQTEQIYGYVSDCSVAPKITIPRTVSHAFEPVVSQIGKL